VIDARANRSQKFTQKSGRAARDALRVWKTWWGAPAGKDHLAEPTAEGPSSSNKKETRSAKGRALWTSQGEGSERRSRGKTRLKIKATLSARRRASRVYSEERVSPEGGRRVP